MSTYKDLGDGNFQKTTESSEQLNVAALLNEIAEHQALIDSIIPDLQAAVTAGTTGAAAAITTLTAQPLSSVLGNVQSLSAIIATQSS